MALVTINGVALPTPSDYQIGVMDITQAERNAMGTMIIERIAQKRKLQLSWKYLNGTLLAQIFTAVNPVFFDVTYLDPLTNTYKTGSFYCGDRSTGMIDFLNSVPRYKDVQFNLIER